MILLKTKLPTAPSPTTTHLMFCMPAMAFSRSSWNDNLDFDNFGHYRGLYIGHREFLGDKGLLGRRPTREGRSRGYQRWPMGVLIGSPLESLQRDVMEWIGKQRVYQTIDIKRINLSCNVESEDCSNSCSFPAIASP